MPHTVSGPWHMHHKCLFKNVFPGWKDLPPHLCFHITRLKEVQPMHLLPQPHTQHPKDRRVPSHSLVSKRLQSTLCSSRSLREQHLQDLPLSWELWPGAPYHLHECICIPSASPRDDLALPACLACQSSVLTQGPGTQRDRNLHSHRSGCLPPPPTKWQC